MAIMGTRPEQTQFSSLLQLVSSSHNLSQPDFKSMEDVLNLEDLSTTSSDSAVSSTTHSCNSPLLRSTSVQVRGELRSGARDVSAVRRLQKPKHQDNRRGNPKQLHGASFSFDHLGPLRSQNFQRSTPSIPPLPIEPSSCRDNAPIPESTEADHVPHSILQTSSKTPHITPKLIAHDSNIDADTIIKAPSLLNSPPTTPRSPSFATDVSNQSPRAMNSYARRKSLDMGPALMQAGIRRLKRSSSMWATSSAQSTNAEGGATGQDVGSFRATTQMNEKQKLINVRRARKLAKVFGSQAPPNMIHGTEDEPHLSVDRRDSISIILSNEALPHLQPHAEPIASASSEARHPSASRSSLDQLDDITLVPSSDTIMSDGAEIPSMISPVSMSTFRERRRRAAKLTQFFGVDYQELVPTITQKIGSFPTNYEMENRPPTVEVDVKVAGRRFWSFSDGRQMKTAEVADVIDQLRGLRAA
ncbi:hypothetical protein Hypma_015357 [Hypsizygus marmoreus]|uniref:Uncharacterized protein n=1 Tax=Hypsizygus marmoreus TaxID=39966 RepID=A0A369K8A9_HYPMA|nr:hypothetical protein Hypma_015357 [Hypsizygus marmoreus]